MPKCHKPYSQGLAPEMLHLSAERPGAVRHSEKARSYPCGGLGQLAGTSSYERRLVCCCTLQQPYAEITPVGSGKEKALDRAGQGLLLLFGLDPQSPSILDQR